MIQLGSVPFCIISEKQYKRGQTPIVSFSFNGKKFPLKENLFPLTEMSVREKGVCIIMQIFALEESDSIVL